MTNGTIRVDFKVAEFDVHIKEKQWLSSSLLKVRRLLVFVNVCCTGTKEAGCLDKLCSGCFCTAVMPENTH